MITRTDEEMLPVEQRLIYSGQVFVNFRTSRQWVLVKLFALPAGMDDSAVLELLIRHVRYRDSYAGTWDEDMKNIHGPYRLDAISLKSFSPVSATDIESLIRIWAEYHGALSPADRDAMEHDIYPMIENATSRYQLADLRETAEHDWGSVVGSSTGFYEFVLINRGRNSVALLVASDD